MFGKNYTVVIYMNLLQPQNMTIEDLFCQI